MLLNVMQAKKLKVIALIPARSGSKRVADKNIRCLGDHPMLAYTISAAKGSGVFDKILLSTDSELYAEIGKHYGAEVPFLRPSEYAGSKSPDIEWVKYTLSRLVDEGYSFDCFSILRPTSPFRQAHTIRRAWELFKSENGVDSLRAVEVCSQHPGKMWITRGNRMMPLLPFETDKQPWHSCQYTTLPEIYIQNASLEIAWTRVVLEDGSIAGNSIVPFFTEGYEGFDINEPFDWAYAEYLISEGEAQLPEVMNDAYNLSA